MDMLRENSKAFAAALATLIVLMLKPLFPVCGNPAFQPALEIVLGISIVALAVWLTPNKPKES